MNIKEFINKYKYYLLGGFILFIIIIIIIIIVSSKSSNNDEDKDKDSSDSSDSSSSDYSEVKEQPSPLANLDYKNLLGITSQCPNKNECRGYCEDGKCDLLNDNGEVALFNGECQNYLLDGNCGISAVYQTRGIDCTSCRGSDFIKPTLLVRGDVDNGGECMGDLEPFNDGGMIYPFTKNQLKNDGIFNFNSMDNIFIKNNLCKKGNLCKNFNPQKNYGKCILKGTAQLNERCEYSNNDTDSVGAGTNDPTLRCSGNMSCVNSKCYNQSKNTAKVGEKCIGRNDKDKTGQICNDFSFCNKDEICQEYINSKGIRGSNTVEDNQIDHIYKKNSSDICNQVARNTTHAYETNPWDISAQPKYKKGLDFSNLGIGDYKGCYYEIEPVKVNNNTNLTAMSNQLYSYENKLPYKTDQNMYYAESSSAISNKGITNILPPPPIWTDSGGKTAALISDSGYENANILNCLTISKRLQKPFIINNYNDISYGCNVSQDNVKYNVNQNTILEENDDYRLVMPQNGLFFTYGNPSEKSATPTPDPTPTPNI